MTQIPAAKSLSAVVDVGVAAVAGAVADLAGDADLQRPRLRAGAERVVHHNTVIYRLQQIKSKLGRPIDENPLADFQLAGIAVPHAG